MRKFIKKSTEKFIEKGKSREFMGMALAVALVVFGVIMAASAIGHFDDGIEQEQDRQLTKTLDSVDYNINDSLIRFDTQMEAFANSEKFTQAVKAWQAGGSSEGVLQQMENSSLANMRTFESMYIMDDDKVLLATIDWMEYQVGDSLKGNFRQCTGSAGNEYLAVVYPLQGNLKCYGIIDVASVYYNTAKRVNVNEESIILLEKNGGRLLLQEDGEIKTCTPQEGAKTDHPGAEEVRVLIDSENNREKTCISYEKKSGKQKLTTRVATMPSEATKNGIFALSASANYDAVEGLARKTATKLILYFAIAAAGLVLMMLIFFRSRREKKQVDLELEQLREKTRQMEELNEKTQELAHHQRLETIGTLTSSIAHEFNNLLTPIMGYSLMIIEKLPQADDIIYDDVLEIYNASVKAKDIISRLSELSRKNTESVFKPIIPDDLVNKVLHVTAPALPKNVDIFRDLHCNSRNIEGNETQLSQLLLNLVINAFQAMGDEGGEIKVSTLAEKDYVVFAVQDNGPGISPEIREKIFDPFFTTKESGAGTGLGLAIAQQAAEDHKGYMEVDSEEGVGTTFKVYIPKADTGLPEGYEDFIMETRGADIVDSEDIKKRI